LFIYTQIFKFVAGKFAWSLEVLQIIEEQSKTDQDLQENLRVADECGGKGSQFLCFRILDTIIFKASDDECVKAAEIYQCGKEKAPVVTSAIQSALTDNQNSVRLYRGAEEIAFNLFVTILELKFCPVRSNRLQVLQNEGVTLQRQCQ
jgi:hypothetical protein